MTGFVEIDDRIGKCKKILVLDPNSQIFAALAEAYRKKGELEKAFSICQNGLRIHPSYGSAHLVMAKINLDRGLYDWAETEVEKVKDIDGNNRAVELLQAEIHIYKREYETAVKLLKRLNRVDPNNDQIKKLLDIAEQMPAAEKADQQRQKQLKINQVVMPEMTDETIIQTKEPPPVVAPVIEKLTPKELLKAGIENPDVQGMLFINHEGLIIENEWAASMDYSVCGVTLAEVSKFLDQELVKASFGNVGSILIETEALIFYLISVSNGLILIVADGQSNLGSLRMKVADLINRYTPE